MANYEKKDKDQSKGKGSTKQNGRRSNNGKGNRKPKDKNQASNEARSQTGRGGNNYNSYLNSENDPRWYTHNQRLVADVTKIPFNSQVGFPIDVGTTKYQVPSICMLDCMTGPGFATSNSDGVNIAGQALFQKLRKDLSTYAGYASADVTMEVLAIVDIFVRYAELARIFGVANLYSSLNLNYSDTLLRAFGLNPGSVTQFRAGFNDLRSRFNNIIYKAQTLYLPAAFPIVERYLWMFSNYFYDHQDPRAQLYAYRPAHYWQLDETGETGTKLKVEARTDNISAMLTNLNNAIERIRNSDSMLKIMADMRNAFKDVTPWKLTYIDEQFLIAPTYSTEVLSQIENTVILPGMPDVDMEITQNIEDNTIIFRPGYSNTHLANYIHVKEGVNAGPEYSKVLQSTVINMHWMNPTSDDIVVATRNIPALVGDFSGVQRIAGMGSDAVIGCTIYQNTEIGSFRTINIPYLYCTVPSWTDSVMRLKGDLLPKDIAAYNAFDWAPRILGTDFTEDEGAELGLHLYYNLDELYPSVEFDNYTYVDRDLMIRIHNNIIMSMWNIPELGTAYN